MSSYSNSETLFQRAQMSIPGGVNSPVRAFKSVGGTPLFIKRAEGAYLYDEDGNQYIDYMSSWGAIILGHSHPDIIQKIQQRLIDGISYGAPTKIEIEMAEKIKSMLGNIDMIRMVNSGTEACMSAIRLARGYTNKNKILKFEGCYHGHADSFLVKAGSGVATLNIQQVKGVPNGVSIDTLTVKYNDWQATEQMIMQHKDELAAVIVEPIAGNMGCVLPQENFLQKLRNICTAHHIILIFDEVMTGFRISQQGAQGYFNIQADLVIYGKVIGGGMPVGAFGGKKEIMHHLAPAGSVYQAGTLSGNPIAMTAGLATLTYLQEKNILDELNKKTLYLKERLKNLLDKLNTPYVINQAGSMISLHFSSHPINNFDDAQAANNELFKKYFHAMLKRGVYLPPSPFESWFLNNALSYQDIDKTIEMSELALKEIL